MSKKFCVMTYGRTGSTSLMYALRQFEDVALPSRNIQCEDEELVHPKVINKYFDEYEGLTGCHSESSNQLIDIFYDHNKQSPFVGFKSMPERHMDSPDFYQRPDIQFITLYRRDIASTVASFIMAERAGVWRRYGGVPDKKWVFQKEDVARVNQLINYIMSSYHALRQIPNAIQLSYEEICQPNFMNEQLDDYFGRPVRIANPRPPTTGASYVVNWDVFCKHVQNVANRIDADFNISKMSVSQRMKKSIPILGATDGEVLFLKDTTSRMASRYKDDFSGLGTLCMFIGYPQSGHSIVGSLLNAHPNIAMAHELDMLKFVSAGFSMEQIYFLLLENSRLFAQHGSIWGKHSFKVDNQWQGKHSELKVVGDKKGGGTSLRVGKDPALLEKLLKEVKLNIRFIHVVRNPYDNIAASYAKSKEISQSISFFYHLYKINRTIISKMDPSQIFELHHEDFIAEPRLQLDRLCGYLGVVADKEYLDACASIVYKKPHKRRDKIKWSPQASEKINQMINEFEFLNRYPIEA